MEMKNEKRIVFFISFFIFYKNEKRMRALKILKISFNLKIVVNPCMESIIQKINFLNNKIAFSCIFQKFEKRISFKFIF